MINLEDQIKLSIKEHWNDSENWEEIPDAVMDRFVEEVLEDIADTFVAKIQISTMERIIYG